MPIFAAVYKGNNSTGLRAALYDGAVWTCNLPIDSLNGNISPKSGQSPAAAYYRGKLYVVYQGDGNNDAFLTVYDGVEWTLDKRISEISDGVAKPHLDGPPALAVYNDRLYLMCGGSNGDTQLKYYTFDGTSWSAGATAKVGKNNTGTNHGVTMAVYNGKLYTVYKGISDEDLRWMSFDGTTWDGDKRIKDTGNTKIKPRTNGSNPGLASFGGRLYIFYKGVGNDDIFVASFDGSTWSGDQRLSWTLGDQTISPRTTEAPRCFLWPNDTAATSLNLLYKGESTGHLYLSTFSDGQWSGNNRIPIQSGPDSEQEPQSSHAPGAGFAPIASTAGSADWMTTNNATIGDKTLAQITLPSSHDTGMHICKATSSALSLFEWTSRTQELDLYSQVVYGGARMLDVRPIYYDGVFGKSGYYCAHYTDIASLFLGYLGQSLDSVCAEIRNALATLGAKEILIINVSHGCDVFGNLNGTTISELSAEKQGVVIGKLLEACGNHLYKADANVNFLTLTVNSIVAKTGTSTVILRLTDDTYNKCGKGTTDGCFTSSAYPTESTYPNTDDEKDFFDKTRKKIADHTKSDTAVFMSWQLSWKIGSSTSLEDYAAKLNPQLGPKLTEWSNDGLFTSVNRPVAIGWDFIKPVNRDDGSKDATFLAMLKFNGLS